MFSFLKHIRKNQTKLQHRDFSPAYFKNPLLQDLFNRNGYVVIKNCVDEEQLKKMTDIYTQLTKMEGYSSGELFVNSGRFPSTEIRNYIISEIRKFSGTVLKNIAKTENCEINNGGSYQIKPPSVKSALNPHQDSPIIDERNHYAVFVWIPLCDITERNGALHVLPKSHLWGNFQRSLNVKWVYERYTSLLEKNMTPLYVNKGDIICFDAALIHSSATNLSSDFRVAFNTAILPKNYQQVHYYRDVNTPKDKVEMYHIDDNFYKDHDIMKKPAAPYKLTELQDWKNSYISKSTIKELIQLSIQ